ncbi:MAG: GNAT family N-acetyltransferase [Candidatus Nanopelagicales bacterium]|nr:GNAT family N-acetyltransferase [Candidatus Nanopelagicales bacterium]MDZ4250144.1 GNAT family N-acetyltransferase [Candidatus Nanopelagicales bacterium]
MTAWQSGVRVLRPGDECLLWPLLASDPVRHCVAASRLADGGLRAESLGGEVWGFGEGELTSAVLTGANLVPIETTADARRAFGSFAVRRPRRCSSIVGPMEEVLDLWSHLADTWGPAREVRVDQPLMVYEGPSLVEPDPAVRTVQPGEIDAIFPACVAMFTEEVGVSPVAGGAGPGYRRRVAALVRAGRAFARFAEGRPVFKAEMGAVSDSACQIQGVWVDPEYRGRGLSAPGMAAVVELASRKAPTVSLYVNSFNERALRTYRKSGFRRVGTFATVLF